MDITLSYLNNMGILIQYEVFCTLYTETSLAICNYHPGQQRLMLFHFITTVPKYLYSPASQLFVQQFSQADIKLNIKGLHHWPFVKGIHWWPVDSLHKGPVMRNVSPCHDDVFMYQSCSNIKAWYYQGMQKNINTYYIFFKIFNCIRGFFFSLVRWYINIHNTNHSTDHETIIFQEVMSRFISHKGQGVFKKSPNVICYCQVTNESESMWPTHVALAHLSSCFDVITSQKSGNESHKYTWLSIYVMALSRSK